MITSRFPKNYERDPRRPYPESMQDNSETYANYAGDSFAGRGPRGYRRSDARILEEVCENLAQHPRLDASDIEVDVKNGIVSLKGSVPDRRMKYIAEVEAETIWGVQDVVNDLRVSRPSQAMLLFLPFALLAFVASPSISQAATGDLLQSNQVETLSKDLLQETVSERGLPAEIRYGVRFYQVRYITSGVHGESTAASGLILLPEMENPDLLPLVSYQHSTIVRKKDAPSVRPLSDEVVAVAALLASRGFGVAIPDGIGLGLSDYPYQPYLHARTEGSSALDFLKATQVFFAQRGILLSGDLFFAGYSQGGHWTLALHRTFDETPVTGFRLILSAPLAAPAELATITFLHSVLYPGRFSTVFSAALFYSYFQIYGNLAGHLSDAIRSPYAERMPTLFSGRKKLSYVYRKLPKRPADLFTEAYLRDVVTNPEHPLRVALAENDLHTWTPQEAILLVHSKQDETVPYTNSEILRENFASRGTQVTLVPLPGEHSHVGGFLPALKIAASHFYPFLDRPGPRQGGTPIAPFFQKRHLRKKDRLFKESVHGPDGSRISQPSRNRRIPRIHESLASGISGDEGAVRE